MAEKYKALVKLWNRQKDVGRVTLFAIRVKHTEILQEQLQD